ncbi:DoxX family protein [Mucilaginibacter sp. 21P]|nr:DoxX family protein [Mucilaginibacter sp. 21P]
MLLIRLSTGGLLLFHGAAKLSHGHSFIREILAEKGMPEWLWLGVPLTEVFSPVLLLLGVFTRMAGAGIALPMLITIFLAHMPGAFNNTDTGGLMVELNLIYMSGALSIAFAGPGKFRVYNPSTYWLQ